MQSRFFGVLVLAVAVTAFDRVSAQSTTQAVCSYQSNVDYVGNDIGNVLGSASECCTKCGLTEGCGAYTWTNHGGGRCWLKSAGGQQRTVVGAQSGVVTAKYTIENNVDYTGNDIGNARGANAEACASICSNAVGCSAFAWTSLNGGTCWLKSSKGPRVSAAGVRSGAINKPSLACQFESGIDYIGNDVGSAPAAKASECCSKCRERPGCSAFSWTNHMGGTCWLKSSRGRVKADPNVQSGVIGTLPTPEPTTPTPTTPAPTTPAPTTPAPPTCQLEAGIDYIGNDVGNTPSAKASDCCAKCRERAGCGAFSWTNYNGGTCWLKSGKGATKVDASVHSGVIGTNPTPITPTPTTPAPPTDKCQLEVGVDYVGNDVGSAPAASASECCNICRARPGCGAFTWSNYEGGTCWLKRAKGETKPVAGVTSAVVSRLDVVPPVNGTHIQYKIRSGEIKSKAVNLGGWLVVESWMSQTSPIWKGVPNATAESGEYLTMKYLGHEQGDARFEEHRKTWIVEDDIREIAEWGLNTVRVPVGHWIVNDDPSTVSSEISKVYAPGSLKYLDTLINDWALKYNVAVILSLHAHQGSQNGFDNGSPLVINVPKWSTSWDNVENSLQYATFLGARYKNSPAFLGMNIMNEPFREINMEWVRNYYLEAYKRIRATGNDCIIAISPHLTEQYAPAMMDFMRGSGFYNVWHEFHPYFKWNMDGNNEQQIIDAVYAYKPNNIDKWTGNPLYLGEWSLASPDSAPFKDRTQVMRFAKAQMDVFSTSKAGWAFWAWRHDDERYFLSGWCMRQLLRAGVIVVPK